jgi:peptidoglycan hydrolase CwlO-like protein
LNDQKRYENYKKNGKLTFSKLASCDDEINNLSMKAEVLTNEHNQISAEITRLTNNLKKDKIDYKKV